MQHFSARWTEAFEKARRERFTENLKAAMTEPGFAEKLDAPRGLRRPRRSLRPSRKRRRRKLSQLSSRKQFQLTKRQSKKP